LQPERLEGRVLGIEHPLPHVGKAAQNKKTKDLQSVFNPFTDSCENAMFLRVPGVPVPFEKFPHTVDNF
jgi:hypothetical protein